MVGNMRNDLQVKATALQHETGRNEIYFDYFTKKGDFVGNIIVSSEGKIEWHIIDATYQDNILGAALYINGNDDVTRLDYESDDYNSGRWNRAKLFIRNSGLVLNLKINSNVMESDKPRITR